MLGPSNLERIQRWRKLRAKTEKLNKMFLDEGAKVVVRSTARSRHFASDERRFLQNWWASRSMPSIIIAKEQYNRIARLRWKKKFRVELAINIQTRFLEEDSLEYNVVAEIPGTDRKLKDEIVMLGGHIDSWHSGTGATDNGAGCAAMMEAVRILKAIDAKPRRTIRIALWTGEEQGLLGLRAVM
ncbi:MAG: M20/M25/M40 family metallo-hydrolase [Calditrichia bacterium]